jgi:hypothetical protein
MDANRIEAPTTIKAGERMMLCEHDNVAPCVQCDIEPLEKENEDLKTRLNHLQTELDFIRNWVGVKSSNDLLEKQSLMSRLDVAESTNSPVPVGWRIKPVSDYGVQGFIIGTPRTEGVRTNTSVWETSDDPDEKLLYLMLASATQFFELDQDS